jgi:MOSC domain-containing protein YiiM
MPCYKLAIRLDRADMVKQFLQSRRTGFYLAVFRVGEVAAGDPIEFTERRSDGVTVAEAVDLYTVRSRSRRLLRRALESPALPDGWKERFRRRLS